MNHGEVDSYGILEAVKSYVQSWRFLEQKMTFQHGDVRFSAAAWILKGLGVVCCVLRADMQLYEFQTILQVLFRDCNADSLLLAGGNLALPV